jgi:hypothetical protein
VGIEDLGAFVGRWELTVDLAGAEEVRGDVVFEQMGEILVQRTTVPVPQAPDSCCVVVCQNDGSYIQHYFDSRGVARLYEMSFDGTTWTLERTKPDLTPLEFKQRFVGTFTGDNVTIAGEWSSSGDGDTWNRDFGMTHRRIDDVRQGLSAR